MIQVSLNFDDINVKTTDIKMIKTNQEFLELGINCEQTFQLLNKTHMYTPTMNIILSIPHSELEHNLNERALSNIRTLNIASMINTLSSSFVIDTNSINYELLFNNVHINIITINKMIDMGIAYNYLIDFIFRKRDRILIKMISYYLTNYYKLLTEEQVLDISRSFMFWINEHQYTDLIVKILELINLNHHNNTKN